MFYKNDKPNLKSSSDLKSFNSKRSLKLAKKQKNVLSYKREVIGILLLAFFSFLIISLISYNPSDVSWFFFSTIQKEVLNWGGIIGANIAALFFYLFGSAAYVFVIMLFYIAFMFLFRKKIREEWDRFLALSLLILVSSVFFKLYNLDFSKSYAGGLVGDSLLKLISNFVGFWGTNILLLALFAASLVILFRISTFKVAKFIAKVAWKFLKLAARMILAFFLKIVKWIWSKIILFFKNIFRKIGSFFVGGSGGDGGDGGYGGNIPSTVIDLCGDKPELIRAGKGSLDV